MPFQYAVCSAATAICCSISVFCIFKPTAPIFLAHWIPTRFYSFFPWGLLTIIFHLYIMRAILFNMLFIIVIVITYLHELTSTICNELNFKKGRFKINMEVVKPENIRREYRCLQLLNVQAMDIFGEVVLFCNFLFVIMPIYGCCSLIAQWRTISLEGKSAIVAMCIGSILFWSIILHLGRYLYSNGKEVLESWRVRDWGSASESKVMRKFTKSCRLLLICYRDVIVIRRHTQFVYAQAIVRGTFRSLLTLTINLYS